MYSYSSFCSFTRIVCYAGWARYPAGLLNSPADCRANRSWTQTSSNRNRSQALLDGIIYWVEHSVRCYLNGILFHILNMAIVSYRLISLLFVCRRVRVLRALGALFWYVLIFMLSGMSLTDLSTKYASRPVLVFVSLAPFIPAGVSPPSLLPSLYGIRPQRYSFTVSFYG